jgi:hypothetical protein
MTHKYQRWLKILISSTWKWDLVGFLLRYFHYFILAFHFINKLQEKLQVAPLLIVGIASRPPQQQETLLHMFISV